MFEYGRVLRSRLYCKTKRTAGKKEDTIHLLGRLTCLYIIKGVVTLVPDVALQATPSPAMYKTHITRLREMSLTHCLAFSSL